MLAAGVNSAISASAYSPPIISYVNATFSSGSNLFSNPLETSSSNFLDEILTNQGTQHIPDGASISFWNPTNLSFYSVSVYTNGSWSSNVSLPPGLGALVITPLPFTNTITGYVAGHDGILVTNEDELTFPPPPVYSGSNGIFLLGDKAPFTDVGTNIFVNILGRPPFPGEQVITLTETNTYFGNGVWDNIPVLNVGQSAFLNITTILPPALSIAYLNNKVIVSWPLSYANWILQTNGDLTSGSWGNYPGLIVNNSVTNLPVGGKLFYRLIY
jgi:hypothetical protein